MAILYVVILMFGAVLSEERLCKEDLLQKYLAVNDETKIKLKNNCEDCMRTYNVDFESLKAAEKLENNNPTNATMCYYRCYYTKLGTLTANQTIDFQEGSQISQEDTYRVSEKCEPQLRAGKDACEGSFLFYQCFVKEINK